MNDDPGNTARKRPIPGPIPGPGPVSRRGDGETLSGAAVIAVLVVVALVITGGYFFAMKMVAVSQFEDCILGHRRNCEPPLAVTPR